jgi:hypothetical protein
MIVTAEAKLASVRGCDTNESRWRGIPETPFHCWRRMVAEVLSDLRAYQSGGFLELYGTRKKLITALPGSDDRIELGRRGWLI